MEKIQEIKESISVKHGYKSWEKFANYCISIEKFNEVIDEVVTEYSSELLRQNREMKEALIKINSKANNSDYEYSERIFDINGYVIDCLNSCNKGKE